MTAAADTATLRCGAGRWMRWAHRAVTVLAAIGLLQADAGLAWTAPCLFLLLVTHGLSARRMAESVREQTRLELRGGQPAFLLAAGARRPVRLRPGAWASRWFCIVPIELGEGEGPRRCLVCRSRNGADAYRRLLVCLRLNGAGPEPAEWFWR